MTHTIFVYKWRTFYSAVYNFFEESTYAFFSYFFFDMLFWGAELVSFISSSLSVF